MGKLKAPVTAGFNAGQNFYAKMVKISDITIDPEISKVFEIERRVLDEIIQSIKRFGFYKDQPVALWENEERLILVDGRTRVTAAKEAGLIEVPASIKEFESREDALLYAFERQALRRNLSSSEILHAAQILVSSEKAKRGEGRLADNLAKRLGVSSATVYQAIDVVKNSAEEDKQKVISGQLSIKKAYEKNRPSRADKPDIEGSAQKQSNPIKVSEEEIMKFKQNVCDAQFSISKYLEGKEQDNDLLNQAMNCLETLANKLARLV